MSIKSDERNLFNKWTSSINQDMADFCPNGGLLFRGNFFLNPPNENGMYTWNREEGNEELLWNNSSRRIMILTKDLNDNELWDIRAESGGRAKVYDNELLEKNVRYLGIPFYRKLNRWIYGIYNTAVDSCIDFDKVRDITNMGRFYEQVPLVRINCKQEVGSSRISNAILKDAIQNAKNLLVEQIEIYGANIILCCGYSQNVIRTGNIILNFLIENIYKDLEMIPNTEEWCYYSKSYNIIAINSYHPTSTQDSDKGLYENLIKNFSKALELMR